MWDGDKAQWGKELWCVIGRYSEDAVDVIRESDGAIGAALIVDCALLARQEQLQEMLEERGLEGGTWRLGKMDASEKNAYVLAGQEIREEDKYIALCTQLPPRKPFFGPTPSIALGKCLLDTEEKTW